LIKGTAIRTNVETGIELSLQAAGGPTLVGYTTEYGWCDYHLVANYMSGPPPLFLTGVSGAVIAAKGKVATAAESSNRRRRKSSNCRGRTGAVAAAVATASPPSLEEPLHRRCEE
jgi:hypothetical protein